MTTRPTTRTRTTRRAAFPKLTDRIAIGDTGLSVSPFCLGWVQDASTIQAAFEAGINFFFITTDMHWPAYEGIRRGLAALLERGTATRDQIVVAAVSYVTQPDFTYMPFLELLDAVPGLGRIDMIVIGGAYGHEFPSRHAIYRENVRRGEFGARAVGTTFHDRAAALGAINDSMVDLAFARCNPVHPGARKDLYPKLRPSPTRVFNFNSMIGYTKPEALTEFGITDDHWHPAPTDHYRFALAHPAVDGLLCSLHHPSEVHALARAMEQPQLDDEELTYMVDLAKLVGGSMRLAGPRPAAAAAPAAAPAAKRARRA